jgi:hypothetical protein
MKCALHYLKNSVKSVVTTRRQHAAVALQAENYFQQLFLRFRICTTGISGSVEHPMTVPTISAA